MRAVLLQPPGIIYREAATTFREFLCFLSNNPAEFPVRFSLSRSLALTVKTSSDETNWHSIAMQHTGRGYRLSSGFRYPATLLLLADYLAVEQLKRLCLVNIHFLPAGTVQSHQAGSFTVL